MIWNDYLSSWEPNEHFVVELDHDEVCQNKDKRSQKNKGV